jgi:NAD(P)-dependent dehydrogenase (short-subunit alcohol dehydrogenase family)
MIDLTGKTALITGANGTLGRAVAARAQALGAKLLLADRGFGRDMTAGHPEAVRLTLDLTDEAALAAGLAGTGRIDLLFNIAGGFAMGETSFEAAGQDWDAMFRINVATLRSSLRVVVPRMIAQGRGSVVNIGALGALKGQARMSAYTASKSVVLRLTESLSAEVRNSGINVNAVLPSVIDTPANRKAMPDADPSRWVAPADLASVICFLGSDAARAIHGALIPVTGLSG